MHCAWNVRAFCNYSIAPTPTPTIQPIPNRNENPKTKITYFCTHFAHPPTPGVVVIDAEHGKAVSTVQFKSHILRLRAGSEREKCVSEPSERNGSTKAQKNALQTYNVVQCNLRCYDNKRQCVWCCWLLFFASRDVLPLLLPFARAILIFRSSEL